MFGYLAGEIVGRPLQVLFPDGAKDQKRLVKKLEKKNRLKHFQTELLKKEGTRLVVDISASRLRRRPDDKSLLFIIKDIAEQKRLEEELRSSNIVLEKLSITDGLTGLYNHRHFQACLKEEFNRAKRFESNLSLIMIDLDDFKLVNDTYGHLVGDQVLIILSELVQECVREVDTPARYGGEEFAVLLPQTGVEDAVVVASRIKDAVQNSPRFQQIKPTLRVTASLGVSGYPEKAIRGTKDLVRFADKALYRAKQIGKNRVVIGGASGEIPLGHGEHLTPSEKKAILRRLADRLRGTLNLNKVLEFVLAEISEIMDMYGESPSCSIMLMDRFQGIREAAFHGEIEKRRSDFDWAARKSLELKKFIFEGEESPHGPIASFPIIVDWQGQGEEVVGVLNLGTVPTDMDFFRDLTNQAALAIVNAKLFREIEESKQSLETKVNQLMTLSLMGMALQRNALNYEDFQDENRKLLARCLVRIGFERAFVFEYDPEKNLLHSGVDDSLRGESAPSQIALGRIKKDGRIMRTLTTGPHRETPVVFLSSMKDLTKGERRVFKDMDISGRQVAIGKIVEENAVRGVVIGLKPQLDEDDGEALSMFVLHAGLIMENLALSRKFQDKNRRMTVIHEIGWRLAQAVTPDERSEAARQGLKSLVNVLGAAEISIYTWLPSEQKLALFAYTSVSAEPGQEPLPAVSLKDSNVMSLVLQESLNTGGSEPVIMSNLKNNLGRKLKKRFSTVSYMGIPLMVGGRVMGIMNVTDKLDQTEFSSADAELAQITAGMMATAIQNIFLLRDIESRTMTAVVELAKHFDAAPAGHGQGHSKRVAELAEGIAQVMGLPESLVSIVRKTALVHDLTPGTMASEDTGAAVYSCFNVLTHWLWELQPVGEVTGHPVEGGKSVEENISWEIIRAAEYIENNYFNLVAKSRPDFANILKTVILDNKQRFDTRVVENLLRGLIDGGIKRSRRQVVLRSESREKLCSELVAHLRKKSRMTRRDHFAKRCLDLLLDKGV